MDWNKIEIMHGNKIEILKISYFNHFFAEATIDPGLL
jgi:hypothetical protein